MKTITNSELSDFLQCRLKWKFAYKDKLAPLQKDQKLRLGSAIHLAIADCLEGKEFSSDRFKNEYFKDYVGEVTEEQFDELDVWLYYAQKVYSEMREIYKDVKVLFVEKKLEYRIPRTKTKYLCKIDAGIENTNGKWILEHKTTSAYNSDYLFNLQINAQPTGYLWCLQKNSLDKYNGILYNIVLKFNKLLKNKKAWIDKNKLVHTEFITRNKTDVKLWLKMMRDIAYEFKRLKIYRSPSLDCRWKCAFKSLCIEDTDIGRLQFRKKRTKYEQYEKEVAE